MGSKQKMQNPANNLMHPGKRHFYVDDLPFASAFASPMAPEPDPADLPDLYDSDEAQTRLLNDALAIGRAPSIAAALGLIARVRGMSGLAAATGIKRQQLYRALREDGNPTLETLTRVTNALGYRLSAERLGGEAASKK
jgi:probable addiction module antidote protein